MDEVTEHPALTSAGRTVPEAMEGVVTTAPTVPAKPQDDPIEDWSDMEGVEREGLFASRHAPEPGASAPALPPAPEKPKKGEGERRRSWRLCESPR